MRLLRRSWRAFLLRTAAGAVARVEGVLPIPPTGPDLAPIFIIGPPRSGTTLLYQVLVQRYRLGYFDNFSVRFYRAPILAAGLLGRFDLGTATGFDSEHGRTHGWRGPHECGEFWYRWFPRGEHVYVAAGATPPDHLEEIRRAIHGVALVSGAPMLLKNTYNSMRIAPLIEAFPNAVFLVSRRGPVDAARSILGARVRANGDKTTWWSLPPRQIDRIRTLPYYEQVVEQVFLVYEQIENDADRFGPDRFLSVHYEELCADARGTASRIEEYLKGRGRRIRFRREIPPRFAASTGCTVEEEDRNRIIEKVNERW